MTYLPVLTAIPAAVRAQFPGVESGIYLNTAAESLFMASHRQALSRYADHKSLGAAGREACAAVETHCRELVGQLLHVPAADIAFLASTARGLDVAIKSIDWQAGDNIVFADSEFPTTAFAALHLSRSGIERRLVRSRDGFVPTAAFAERIDRRTRLVVASLVSYRNGFRIDLAQLANVAHAHGALLFVDAVQAVGAVDIDATPADFLCAGTYEWVLGAHGMAIFYVNSEIAERLEPPYVGYRGVTELFAPDRYESYHLWPDARRFEEGMPNYLGMHVLENALTFLLDVGIANIAEHNALLVERLMAGLLGLGVEPLTPRDPAHRGAIVSFPTSLESQITAQLARDSIGVWGRDGRVRMAPHLYNTAEEIDVFLQHLQALNVVGR
ncbi:MAG TPA: aminotransferase class V-fold PLP-dependent enzyme [Jatrophihabitans sp.]|jgi:selenocysteine lyase/cysteine desulfurase